MEKARELKESRERKKKDLAAVVSELTLPLITPLITFSPLMYPPTHPSPHIRQGEIKRKKHGGNP